MERVNERGVKMYFRPDGDREIPLIIGLMPILPKHLTDRQEFEKTTLKPLIGSGPYTIDEVVPGTRLTFKRNPDYWGRNLPVNCGFNNFDEIRYEFFRDQTAMFEAFKKGHIHVLSEDDAGQWASEYDFPAVTSGKVAKAEFDSARPAGMHALVFNTRRAIFTDIRVRKALTFLFDFEWQNANLYRSLYQRTQSFFERSELSSAGRPADLRERTLLAPFPNAVTPEIMEGTFHQPVSDGSGRDRNNRRKALRLLQAAGYTQVDGKLVNKATGQPFRFEMMAKTRNQERLFLLFARDLQSVGIEVSVRQVDDAQFQRRLDKFDFDMIDFTWGSSLSPGNEQNNRWSMAAAGLDRSFNFPGVKEPAVDAMIAALLAAKSREDFVSAVRALDRVLLSGAYVLPLYYPPKQWVAHWNTLGHPKIDPIAGMQITAWWMKTDTDKSAKAKAVPSTTK
jgi:peptide/nickel transport system substrate-binding protein